MIKLQNNMVSILLAIFIVTNLSACSAFNKVGSFLGDKKTVNYQNNASVKDLEFPPDLTAPEFDKEFELPSTTVSAVAMSNGTSFQPNATSVNFQTRSGDLASIRSLGGESVLQVNDTYPRALVLTDIMLERMGFSIISRNAAGNVYRVQYNGEDIDIGEKSGRISGFFNRAKDIVGFGGSNNKALVKGQIYQTTISNQQGVGIVRFTNAAGQALPSKAHTKIITLLNNEFNR